MKQMELLPCPSGTIPNPNIENSQMFVDGRTIRPEATMSTGPQESKARLYVGVNTPQGKQYFKGSIDQVILVDRVLDGREIASLLP
jgi:hypothetical protein